MKCRQCGTENADGMKFCGECGTPVAAPAAGPESVDTLPSPVVAREAVPDRDAERKLVTVLFADVVGFTTLAETLDPEPLRDLVNACFDRLVPCIERYGGTVDKFIGDEIMALFGAPVAHDNDPERAVRAALDMRAALAAFNGEQGTDLQAHFGINTGLVLAGAVGSSGHTGYSVMGDAVNVASRLAETSAPSEILVGPDTYRLAGHLFTCEETGSVPVRGRAERVRAYRVLGQAGAAGAAPTRAGRWVGSPLVGRDREKEAFVAALDRTLQGEGGILTIVADAGLGKSRLTAEVRRLAGPDLTWLEGRTLSFGRAISYWPFLELLQAAAGIDSDDEEAERSEKLERLAARLFVEETANTLPYLATFLSLPVPEELQEKVRYLDGEAMGRQVFRTMRLFVSRLAKERPLVLVFEDVHWLDGSSVDLLEHLLPLSREAAVLFCLVGRPEVDSPTLRPARPSPARPTPTATRRSPSSPLSAQETRTLVGNLVGLRDLPLSLREAIDHKAEGNPFFVEEVVRALIDLGGLVPDEHGRWQVTKKAQEIRIPDTLQGVIMARIDRLDEELKATLRLAAVIGRSFFYRVLRSLSEAEAPAGRRHRHLAVAGARPGEGPRPGARIHLQARPGAGGDLRVDPAAAPQGAAPPGRHGHRRPLRRPPGGVLRPPRLPLLAGGGLGEGPRVPPQGRRPGGPHRRRRRGPRPLRAGHGGPRQGLRRHLGPLPAGGAGAQDRARPSTGAATWNGLESTSTAPWRCWATRCPRRGPACAALWPRRWFGSSAIACCRGGHDGACRRTGHGRSASSSPSTIPSTWPT